MFSLRSTLTVLAIFSITTRVFAGDLKDSSTWTRDYIASVFQQSSPNVDVKDFELASPVSEVAWEALDYDGEELFKTSCQVFGEDVAKATSQADGWGIRPSYQFRYDINALYRTAVKNYGNKPAEVLSEFPFLRKSPKDYVFTGGWIPNDYHKVLVYAQEIIENVGPTAEGFSIVKWPNNEGVYVDFGGQDEKIDITIRKSGTTLISRYVDDEDKQVLGYKICQPSNRVYCYGGRDLHFPGYSTRGSLATGATAAEAREALLKNAADPDYVCEIPDDPEFAQDCAKLKAKVARAQCSNDYKNFTYMREDYETGELVPAAPPEFYQ